MEVRYRPGTPGEKAARAVAAAAIRARRNLRGLGTEPTGVRPVIFLDDPFPDPDNPATMVTAGSVIDDAHGEIWMVAAPEAPPEDPHRALALLFGSGLPAPEEVELLLEGYGLHLADVPSTRPALAEAVLPPLDAAEGELRSAMAVDYVRFLLEREEEEVLRRLLAAPRGQLESSFQSLYGTTTAALEEAWRAEVAAGEPEIPTGQFLGMSLRYLRPYWLRELEILLYMLLSLAFTAAFPFVSRQLFDDAIPSGEFSEVVGLLGILAVAFTVSLVAGLRQAYQSAWVSGAVGRDIRQAMFGRLQTLPFLWFQDYPQGDVLSRLFSDVTAVQAGLANTIGQGIYQALTLVVATSIMLTINLPLGLVVLVSAPLVALVYKAMARGARDRSLAVREENSALLGVAAENYTAIPVVKLFGLRRRESGRFRRQADRLFRAQRRLNLFGGLFGLSVNMIVTLLRLAVLGFGAWLILEGRFTLGGLVAFLAIMGDVLSPVTVLTSLGQNIQAVSGALVRINEVLDAAPEPGGGDGPELPALAEELVLSDVSFSYAPERRVIDGLDAVIPAGSSVAFVGPSGSGKSTVLRLIMRLLEPEEGVITLDGVDIASATMASLRDQMAVVFQEPILFDTTIRENIALGKPGATEEEIVVAAEAAELGDTIAGLARGYDTLVGQRGTNLSGGQRQRVAIARALIRNPRLLLLDEATSALDPATESDLNDTLRRVGAGRTVISITHRLTSITDYDEIFVIRSGRLVESGTHDELVSLGDVYATLWSEQTGAEIRERPPFDAAAALGNLVLFRDVGQAGREDIATHLRAFVLQPGEEIGEGDRRLMLVARGRGEILTPSLGGQLVVTGRVGVGDAFGLRSILGAGNDTRLRAVDAVTLLELDNAALDSIAARHAVVAAVLDTTMPGEGGPVGGRKMAPVAFIHAGPRPAVAPEGGLGGNEPEVRRTEGAAPGVTPS